MNVAIQPRPMTRDQFFDWAQRQDARYEFDGVRPVLMTGGTRNHNRIYNAIHRALHARLDLSRYEALGPDAGIATIGGKVRYPDAVVAPPLPDGDALLIPGVIVVFEVVSKTSSQTDRIEKVPEYEAVPSILRYVIVERTSIGLLSHHRENGGQPWTTRTLAAGQMLDMPEIGISIPVTELYNGTILSSDTATE